VDESEPGAAVLFRVDQAQPSLLGELGPEFVGHARRLLHPRSDERGRALVLEKLPRGRAEHLLLRAEAEIPGASPSAGRAAAPRPPPPRPSSPSPPPDPATRRPPAWRWPQRPFT